MPRPAPSPTLRLASPATAHENATLLALALLACLLVLARVLVGLSWPVPLSVDEAQYWVWAREIQGGYYSKPPFIAMVLSLPMAACGNEVLEGCVRALQPLGFAGAALFLGLTAHHLLDSPRAAVWTALLLLAMPLAVFYSQIASTDAWLAFWWALAMLAFVRAAMPRAHPDLAGRLPLGGVGWWVLLGFAVGMGMLTKYSMAAFVLPAAILLMARRQWWRAQAMVAVVVALVLVMPNLLWNAQWGFPTFAHHADITVAQRTSPSAGRLLEFLGLQVVLFGPAIVALGLAVGRLVQAIRGPGPSRDWGSSAVGVGLWFGLPILGMACLQAFLGKANANWAAPAGLGLVIATVGWVLGPQAGHAVHRAWLLRFALGLGLAATVVFLALPWLISPLGLDADRRTNPLVPLLGYKEAATTLRAAAPTPHLASANRGLLAAIDAYWPEANPKAWWPSAQGTPPHHWALQHRLNLQDPTDTSLYSRRWLVVESVRQPEAGPQASLRERLQAEASQAGLNVQTQPLAETDPALAQQLAKIQLAGRPGHAIEGVWVWAVKMPSNNSPSPAPSP